MTCNSMTGYGQALVELNATVAKAEVRSVNHRFSEFNLRLPRELFSLEDEIRQLLGRYIKRGRTDLFVSFDFYGSVPHQVSVNWNLLDALYAADEAVRKRYAEHASEFANHHRWLEYPNVLTVESVSLDIESLRAIVLQVVEEACGGLADMRRREGERLAVDLAAKAKRLRVIVQSIQQEVPVLIEHYRNKIERKRAEFLPDVDPIRFMTEIAGWFEKMSIDEELVRLDSHLVAFEHALEQGSPIGRKLDFIVQELHREVNTIGAKATGVNIANAVVAAKTLVEQMREQVQNLE